MDQKQILHDYLRQRRGELLAKLDGLSDYDARRPLTPTGTNLAGLVKHVASVQLGYFGVVFDRPSAPLPWEAPGSLEDDDMWLQEGESVADVVAFHHRSAEHADATIESLELESPGLVPWWPDDRRRVTLGRILVHNVAEVARHAGHADILRESLDGAIGNGSSDPNIPGRTTDEWATFSARIEAAAWG